MNSGFKSALAYSGTKSSSVRVWSFKASLPETGPLPSNLERSSSGCVRSTQPHPLMPFGPSPLPRPRCAATRALGPNVGSCVCFSARAVYSKPPKGRIRDEETLVPVIKCGINISDSSNVTATDCCLSKRPIQLLVSCQQSCFVFMYQGFGLKPDSQSCRMLRFWTMAVSSCKFLNQNGNCASSACKQTSLGTDSVRY